MGGTTLIAAPKMGKSEVWTRDSIDTSTPWVHKLVEYSCPSSVNTVSVSESGQRAMYAGVGCAHEVVGSRVGCRDRCCSTSFCRMMIASPTWDTVSSSVCVMHCCHAVVLLSAHRELCASPQTTMNLDLLCNGMPNSDIVASDAGFWVVGCPNGNSEWQPTPGDVTIRTESWDLVTVLYAPPGAGLDYGFGTRVAAAGHVVAITAAELHKVFLYAPDNRDAEGTT